MTYDIASYGPKNFDESIPRRWSRHGLGAVSSYRPKGSAILEYSDMEVVVTKEPTPQSHVAEDVTISHSRRSTIVRVVGIILLMYVLLGVVVAVTQHNRAAQSVVSVVLVLACAIAYAVARRRT